jgi:hypothetical protein
MAEESTMSKTTYAFAEHLPHDARVAAATADYRWNHIRRRTKDGCCPLGVALRAAEFDVPASPDSRCVSLALFLSDEWTPLRRSVAKFIHDWDGHPLDPGYLERDDLPRAFGVRMEMPR